MTAEKPMKFDDIVKDKHGSWTQVCIDCSTKLDDDQLEPIPCANLICGVEGCSKEAAYYYDIAGKN